MDLPDLNRSRYHGEDAHTQGFVAHHGVRSYLTALDVISQVRLEVALVAPWSKSSAIWGWGSGEILGDFDKLKEPIDDDLPVF